MRYACMPVLVSTLALTLNALVHVAFAADADVIPIDPRLQTLFTDLARQAIPHDYENEKAWGKTKEVVRGLYVKREGLRIKTHRTTKTVNHGTWKKYRIQLLDPEGQFQVRVANVRRLPNQHFVFDVVVDARVRIFGRLSQWERGVQLVSLSAEADADVQLAMQCDLATKLEIAGDSPGLTIDPTVQAADLQIRSFQMRHISQLDGPLVRTLSASIREVLEDEFEDRRERLPAQINRQLDKHRDQMHLSFKELLESARDERRSSGEPLARSNDG